MSEAPCSPKFHVTLPSAFELALVRAARIFAGMRGGDFVTPDDVKQVAPLVIPHRLMLAPEALLEGVTEQAITQQLLDRTPVPR